MEGYLDEFNRRAALCDNLSNEDQEAQLQEELMFSNCPKLLMSEYLKLPDDDHTIDVLLEVINAEISVRDMVLRNQYENRMNREGENPAFNFVTKERPDKPQGKGKGQGKNGRGGGAGGYAATIPAPPAKTWQYQSGWEPSAKREEE